MPPGVNRRGVFGNSGSKDIGPDSSSKPWWETVGPQRAGQGEAAGEPGRGGAGPT